MTAFDSLIDPMSGRQHADAPERTLGGTSCGKVTRPTPSPVTRGEVEAAVVKFASLDANEDAGCSAAMLRGKIIMASVDVARLFGRLFAERDEAVSRAKVCREDVETNAARAEKADGAAMKATRERDDLARVLGTTATMLDYEATCHEESGETKRRTYVGSLRMQVKSARAVLAKIGGAS